MIIRGWIILGPPESSLGLPPAATAGIARGDIPPAKDYSPGTWIFWQPNPNHNAIVLVCVEHPL